MLKILNKPSKFGFLEFELERVRSLKDEKRNSSYDLGEFTIFTLKGKCMGDMLYNCIHLEHLHIKKVYRVQYYSCDRLVI